MATIDMIRPTDANDLREVVADARGNGQILEVRGGGSKRDIGKPDRGTAIVDLGAFTGIVDYEASELVLTVRPATPLAEIEKLLADHRQMLAFEPIDHGPLFGHLAGAATIGGVVAAGVAGSRRVSAGGARDHLLGFAAVSRRGEPAWAHLPDEGDARERGRPGAVGGVGMDHLALRRTLSCSTAIGPAKGDPSPAPHDPIVRYRP
jgi:FAD/FMN-containing dehydrogenase